MFRKLRFVLQKTIQETILNGNVYINVLCLELVSFGNTQLFILI